MFCAEIYQFLPRSWRVHSLYYRENWKQGKAHEIETERKEWKRPVRCVQQRSFFPRDNREHLTTMQPAASKAQHCFSIMLFQTAPSIPRKHSQPQTLLLTCLTATVHIRLNYASILKHKALRLEAQMHKLLLKKLKECTDFSQTWIHSVSLKGGQTTPEARTTAPTAVSIQSKRVQLATHELPACKPHQNTLSG